MALPSASGTELGVREADEGAVRKQTPDTM
jgi:hypothetical protein